MQYLRHGGTCYISALFRKTALGQITSCVLGISHIHIGNNIHNPAVCLLRQTLVLATVSGFHVKDRNMQTLGRDSRQAGIGIPENQQCIGLYLCHQLIRAIDNIADGCAQIIANGIHIYFRSVQFQILKKHTV